MAREVQRGRPPGRRPKPRTRAAPDPNRRVLEEELQRFLGTEVRIRADRKGDRGRIEITFYGVEDFERLFELLARKPAVDVVS